jgi:hypothetical protein
LLRHEDGKPYCEVYYTVWYFRGDSDGSWDSDHIEYSTIAAAKKDFPKAYTCGKHCDCSEDLTSDEWDAVKLLPAFKKCCTVRALKKN